MQLYRDKTFYVLTFIIPLVVVDLLVFVVYALDLGNLEGRMVRCTLKALRRNLGQS